MSDEELLKCLRFPEDAREIKQVRERMEKNEEGENDEQ